MYIDTRYIWAKFGISLESAIQRIIRRSRIARLNGIVEGEDMERAIGRVEFVVEIGAVEFGPCIGCADVKVRWGCTDRGY